MRKKILVVDDSPVIRQQVRQCLEKGGYDVSDADGGEAGLRLAQDQGHDLIISDVNMPDMDGIEMVARVRQLPGYERTPIFMLTTEASKEMAQRGKEVGATVWIVKPFNPPVLLKGIAKILGA